MFAQVQGTQVIKFPILNIRQELPNVSLPEVIRQEDLPEGYVVVAQGAYPAPNPATEKVVENGIALVNGQWETAYQVVPLSSAELAAQALRIQQEIVTATQDRLDAFARTRNYDGILSLCTYATSSVPKFSAEGQRGVDNRDATWSTLYNIMAEVEAGTRPMPTGYADIEPELPSLAWPNS